MTGRVLGIGLALLAGLLPAAALLALILLHGPEALLALSFRDGAIVLAGLLLPPALLPLTLAAIGQRAELAALRQALLRQVATLDARQILAETLIEELRAQTALLQEQVRLALSDLALGKRRLEVAEAQVAETRLQRLVAEWDLVVAELHAILAAMWRLAFGWRAAGPDRPHLPLPPAEELPLCILRLLPPTPEEMAKFEVEERFVRQAARYRATFQAFLERVPEAGPLPRAFFRGLIYGQLDARLALLPRPNHARVIDPATLAAE